MQLSESVTHKKQNELCSRLDLPVNTDLKIEAELIVNGRVIKCTLDIERDDMQSDETWINLNLT